MKCKILLSTLTLSLMLSAAQAQDRKQAVQPIDKAEKNASSALIEIARRTNTNFIADATSFDKQSGSAENLAQPQVLILDNVLSRYHLTLLNRKPIALLWTQPDLSVLTELMKSGQSIKVLPVREVPLNLSTAPTDENTQELSTPKTNENALERAVFAYLQENKLWDEQNRQLSKTVKVSDLPTDLHDSVVASIQSVLLKPQSFVAMNAWFNDKFWEDATLGISRETNGVKDGPKIPVLTVGGEFLNRDKNGAVGTIGTKMSLGALEKTQGGGF